MLGFSSSIHTKTMESRDSVASRVHDLPLWLALLFTCAYALSGYVSFYLSFTPYGSSLGTPSLAIPLYAPAGLAVAGVLHYGFRIFPAVFLGNVLFLWLSGMSGFLPDLSLPTIVIDSIFAVLQCFFAWFIASRLIGVPCALDNGRAITLFLLIVAPLAPIVGLLAEVVQTFLPHIRYDDGNYLFFLWIRWVGDVLGIILYAPLILILLNCQRGGLYFVQRLVRVVLPLTVLLIISYIVLYNINVIEAQINQEKFEQEATILKQNLLKRFDTQQEILVVLASFIASQPNMKAETFRLFTMPWLQRHPDTLNLTWNPLVLQNNRLAFEADLKAQFSQNDLQIVSISQNGHTFPAPRSDQYFPIKFIEPLARNQWVLGLDPYQSSTLRLTLLRAFSNHQPTFSKHLRLIQEVHAGRYNSAGVGIYYPVYAQHTRELLGIVSSMLHLNEVLNSLVEDNYSGLFEVCLSETSPHSHSQQLGDDSCQEQAKQFRDMPTSIQALQIGGQHWELYVHANQRYLDQQRYWILWLGLAIGLVAVTCAEGFILLFYAHNHRIERHVHTLAHYDSLTQLPNRAYWRQLAQKWIDEKRSFALLFFDLDHFKTINDSLGHNIGDQLLAAIAHRLEQESGKEALLGRHGGDEFVLLFPTDTFDVKLVRHQVGYQARILLRVVGLPLHINHHELLPTVSIGIATYPADGQDIDTLMRHADLAMYEAKSMGRNQFAFFEQSMNEYVQERLLMENMLRKAIENGELLLYYQPQYDTLIGRANTCEALVRWKHPGLGFVMPSQFIPIAEESGLIVPMGEWILREACRQQVAWRKMGHDISIAVNISALQFAKTDFNATVFRILEETGADPAFIELEVTETALVNVTDVLLQRLHELRAYGLALALDDFGTGYSCLSYLKKLPITNLKLDRSFVKDLPVDAEDAAIASATVSMATDLGMGTVAEGVETEEQLAFLRARGCRYMQGYLFSKPVPAEEMLDVVARIEAQYPLVKEHTGGLFDQDLM